MVHDLANLTDTVRGEISVGPTFALCRCGASKNKPFCDGTHTVINFVAEKEPDRVADRVKDYVGKEIIIHDNRGVCSHDGACTRNSPGVFDLDKKPWINPDGASAQETIETIQKCPSGALSYTIGGRLFKNLDREPCIKVSRHGPLKVVGFVEFKDDQESAPESAEHYTLCRCGLSKNKPFCDGTHMPEEFRDEGQSPSAERGSRNAEREGEA
jgi:CDGSH-type Zn-finger protein